VTVRETKQQRLLSGCSSNALQFIRKTEENKEILIGKEGYNILFLSDSTVTHAQAALASVWCLEMIAVIHTNPLTSQLFYILSNLGYSHQDITHTARYFFLPLFLSFPKPWPFLSLFMAVIYFKTRKKKRLNHCTARIPHNRERCESSKLLTFALQLQ
jgi:hypothetical protein